MFTSTYPSTVRRLLILAAAVFALTLALPAVANAGNGTLRNGQYNFCVSVRFNATPAQLQQIRDAFQNASQILADATDGQQRFGTVAIVNDSGASESAEYWVNAGGGRAYATAGQYGVRGQHVMLFFNDNFQGANAGPNGDAYTIAHEHAHHAFGVLDEYSGPGGGAECAAPPDTPAMNFCLMDNYFTRGGNAGGTTAAGYTLNEFCVASNHDPDMDTYQESINHQSCWATIAAHPKRSAAAPAGLPVGAAPGAHAVSFETGTAGLRVILVLDRSGSMSAEQRLDFAKQGANQFIDLLRVGDSVGVVSFSDSVSVNFPVTAITGPGTQSSAKTAVNSLNASGSTNIGGGLQAALNQITSQADHSCNNVIVLLSDGDHNTGTPPASVIPALQDEGVTVLSVGLGAGISAFGEATLQNVATQTGGKFYRVSNAADLIALFTQLSAETTGSGLLTRAPETVNSGQVKESSVLVEAGAQSATFAVAIANPADAITLTLRTPSGTLITQADAGANPNVEFIDGSNSRIFIIHTPEAGTWKMIVTAGPIVNGNLEFLAFADHDGVQLNAAVLKDTLAFPEPITILATPRFGGESVLGALVSGNVIRPDGSRVAITLFDDGLAAHGDAVAADGSYAARFSQYSGNGTYTFELKAVVALGMTYSGEDIFAFAPSNTNTVSPFIRSASSTAVVTGVPTGTDLSITKTASPATVLTGSNITYKVTVTNNGTSAASNVTVSDVLPATTTFVSCSSTGAGICGGAGNNRQVTFGSIAPASSEVITLLAKVNCPVPNGTLISNAATVSAQTPDPDASNNSTPAVTTTASNPPPVITNVAVNPPALWPPDHKLVNITVNYKVTDNCGPVTTTLSVKSNEPTNGTGDGDTSPDWEVLGPNLVRLRAERAGTGTGRIYTITIKATDSAGYSSTQSVTVTVPKSQK
ncbi:MAG TPA: VWA domain-containing protein [Pyrinomonadaceae bacterium]|jgi:uncharacterized repeat protein (TIGR01451 family)|nr:VWA domain-containing protein [Pyrinomonadaceae bacterium]